MRYFAIEAKKDEKSQTIAKRFEEKLLKNNFLYDEMNPDFVVIVGGDGKLIRSIHKYMDNIDKIKFFTIMTGTLGFYMNFLEEELEEVIDLLKSNNYEETKYNLLKATSENKEAIYAINEIRIENRHYTSIIDVVIDGLLFETFRGNGLVVSSSFGSSAYNRSLGGAIISDDLKVMQLTEIAGIHHNSYRSLSNPLILGKDRTIELEAVETKNTLLGYDHVYTSLKDYQKIKVTLSDKQVTLINKKGYTYFHRLRSSFMY